MALLVFPSFTSLYYSIACTDFEECSALTFGPFQKSVFSMTGTKHALSAPALDPVPPALGRSLARMCPMTRGVTGGIAASPAHDRRAHVRLAGDMMPARVTPTRRGQNSLALENFSCLGKSKFEVCSRLNLPHVSRACVR